VRRRRYGRRYTGCWRWISDGRYDLWDLGK
jgi:hypothetical protein